MTELQPVRVRWLDDAGRVVAWALVAGMHSAEEIDRVALRALRSVG